MNDVLRDAVSRNTNGVQNSIAPQPAGALGGRGYCRANSFGPGPPLPPQHAKKPLAYAAHGRKIKQKPGLTTRPNHGPQVRNGPQKSRAGRNGQLRKSSAMLTLHGIVTQRSLLGPQMLLSMKRMNKKWTQGPILNSKAKRIMAKKAMSAEAARTRND